MAGAALCEPPCADFVAGAAFCEPPCADFVAGTALCAPLLATLSTTLVRGVSVELEAENWRLSSTTLVRGAICRAGS